MAEIFGSTFRVILNVMFQIVGKTIRTGRKAKMERPVVKKK